ARVLRLYLLFTAHISNVILRSRRTSNFPSMSSANNDYWVYIVTNNTRSTLYIGVTSELRVRMWQHRAGDGPGTFSQRYHCAHLVYFEHYREIRDAIAREKQLKGWRRAKKNALIATLNPHWGDLAADWFDNFGKPNTCHPERAQRSRRTSHFSLHAASTQKTNQEILRQ